VTRLLLLAVFAVAASSCGGRTSISCNNTGTFACSTSSVTGAGLVITNASCPSPSVEVSSCPTAGVIGTCTISTAVTTPAAGTATQVATVYTGGDAAGAHTACTSSGGTWAAP
jgi:hypothetical protein